MTVPSIALPCAVARPKPARPGRGTSVRIPLFLWLALCIAACQGHTVRDGPLPGREAVPTATALPADTVSADPIPSGGRGLASEPTLPPAVTASPAGRDAGVVIRGGGKRAVRGTHGLVASGEAQATRVGVSILQQGGNAVDAAVAVAYALAVTLPSAGNLGGGGFMLVAPPGGKPVAIDFRETAPASLTRSGFDRMIEAGGMGPVSVGVPGTVAGLELAHERFGRLPRAQVLEPAVRLAQRHRIGTREGLTLSWNWSHLAKDPASRSTFGANGRPKPNGTLLERADLARTLQGISDQGRDGFYRGEAGAALVRRLGGAISATDLAGYQAKVRDPLCVRYRGLDVCSAPPPSGGGVVLVESLLVIQSYGARDPGTTRDLHLFLEVSRRAQADRQFYVVDPDALPAAAYRERVRQWTTLEEITRRWAPIALDRASTSASVDPLAGAGAAEPEHTTHLSVLDGGGMAVSCTVTLSAGFGAKIMVPGTGILLNNAVASFSQRGENLPAPGRRTISSMAPTLVSERGAPVLVLGTPGGNTIPGTIVQVLRNVVDRGMTIDEAVEAPRVHHRFVPDEVRSERRRPLAPRTRQELVRLGHRLSDITTPIGDANCILVADGVAWGYADSREGGLALAAELPANSPSQETRPAPGGGP